MSCSIVLQIFLLQAIWMCFNIRPETEFDGQLSSFVKVRNLADASVPTPAPTLLCDTCASGKYDNVGVCTDCPAGYRCQGACNAPSACAAGKYTAGGESSCNTCTAGNYCPSVRLGYEIPCAPGTYSAAQVTVCTMCPAGFMCTSSTGSGGQVACSSGSFATGGSSVCTVCPMGFRCTSTTSATMTPCGAGFYSLGQSETCTQCPAGYTCPSRAAPPKKCPAGSYSSAGAAVCTSAAAGYFAELEGSSTQSACVQGFYSTGGATACTACNAGYNCIAGSSSPTPISGACPIGSYCPDSITAVDCPLGTYGIRSAARSQAHGCTSCEPGYYCPVLGGQIGDRVLCPVGTYCPMGSGVFTNCPGGFANGEQGQMSAGACKPCGTGVYCPTGSSSSTDCPAHHYCPAETTNFATYPCPSGRFSAVSSLIGAWQCSNCTIGHYCSGGAAPTVCPAGRYNPHQAVGNVFDCTPCEPGFACPSTAMVVSNIISCAAGYYCPSGTSFTTEFSCPAGKYSDSTSLSGSEQCTTCPSRSSCGVASKSSDIVACPAGHFCPAGTWLGQEQDCLAGTYSAVGSLEAANECTTCDTGSYCSGGETAVSGPCQAGHYCQAGTTHAGEFPCLQGTYTASTSLTASHECTDAALGYYATAGSSVQTACPAGKYSSVTNTHNFEANGLATIMCTDCTAGYYCVLGATAPANCGTGSYSATGASVCTTCDLGRYCGSTTTTEAEIIFMANGGVWDKKDDLMGTCFPGTLCPAGMIQAPDLVSFACSAGYYCARGVTEASPCPAGTYNALSGAWSLSNCTTSAAGFYSVAASTAVNGICSPGFYCLEGSGSPTEYPCPAGTYRPDYQGTAVSDCGACPAGSYCPMASYKPLLCPRGYYCPSSTSEPIACLPATYGNVAGLISASDCTPCDAGYYCDTYALQAPRGMCNAGFFCLEGSNTAAPTGTYPSSGPCTAGHYCPVGAVLPVACPAGTYSPNAQNTAVGDCTSCPVGKYCEGTANTAPDGDCDAGYYCTGGSITATQFMTPAGYFTVAGAAVTSPCIPGTYQTATATSACLTCPPGYYCPNYSMTTIALHLCPAGSFCPTGSINTSPCPIGTYAENAGNDAKYSGCTPCTPGSYCASEGLTAPTGLCTAGYYCTQNATMAIQGTETDTGGRCTAGHYCFEGTADPVPCPAGTFMANILNDGINEFFDMGGDKHNFTCTPCTNSNTCTTTGLSAPDGNCGQGYWCNLGATESNAACSLPYCENMFGICPANSYCPANSHTPVSCPAGTYNTATGLTACTTCPEGYYCLGAGGVPVTCPAGSYCPAGTKYHNEFVCPVGTYSTAIGLTTQSDCQLCAAGYYCSVLGVGIPDSMCDAGYFCGGGSSTPTPSESDTHHISYVGDTCVTVVVNATINDMCPPGHYCPQGSTAPQQCPPGTVSFSTGRTQLSDCQSCPGGYWCPSSATTNTSRICPGGNYCPEGTVSPIEYCPRGTMCPTQAHAPTTCPGGYHQNSTHATSCDSCPMGYYCPVGAFLPTDCPIGYYCPANSASATVCPSGTYNDNTLLGAEAGCISCPAKQYCDQGQIQGVCSLGFFCRGGSGSPTPTIDVSISPYNTSIYAQTYYLKMQNNAQCPAGYYCDDTTGTLTPTACPNGTVYEYTHGASSSVCGYCPAGTYCVDGSPTPVDCDLGKYCPFAQDIGLCPNGTYGHQTGLAAAAECQVCPAGYDCNAEGVINYTMYPCPTGHYCTGAGDPIPCPAGKYLPTTGASAEASCLTCPLYNWCPAGSSHVRKCPEGYYCDIGSASATECPPGTYCPTNSTTYTVCPAQYYCPGGTSNSTVCYQGTYCPEGTANPELCPAGTYGITGASASILATLATACADCAPGKYGNDPSRLDCYVGTPGYAFYGGTTGPTPVNVTTENGEICPTGHYCPVSTSVPVACPAGYFQPTAGSANATSCTLCPSGSYSYATGAAACLTCSSSSRSGAGSTSCTCIGINRAFQPIDGMCICNPGYEFVDTDFTVSSEADGAYDCQPVVYTRCATTERRDTYGNCVDKEDICSTTCGATGGVLSSTTGICECNIITPLDSICDSTCQAAAPVTACSLDGLSITITYASYVISVPIADYVASTGSIDCSVAGSKIITMSTTSGAFAGVYGAPPTIAAAASRRRLSGDGDGYLSTPQPIAIGRNRNRNNTKQAGQTLGSMDLSWDVNNNGGRRLNSDPTISNPVVCIHAGDSIVFDISTTQYPIYVKDALLNTNANFDYANFRVLVSLASSSVVSLSTFSFTFADAGSYVFALSDDPSIITVVSVVGSGLTCTSPSFTVLSDASLVTLGVTSNSSIVLGPDWPLVVGLLLGILALVVCVIALLYYFRKRAWGSHQDIPQSYRDRVKSGKDGEIKSSKGGMFEYIKNALHGPDSKINPTNLDDDADLDALINANDSEKKKSTRDLDDEDVEFQDDMLIPELAKHMQAQNEDIANRLDKNKEQVDSLTAALTSEVDELKALLHATALQMSSAGGSEAAKVKKLRQLLEEAKKNALDRERFVGEMGLEDTKARNFILGSASKLQKLLQDGSYVTAKDIVDELEELCIKGNDAANSSEKESLSNQPCETYGGILKDLNDLQEFSKSLTDEENAEVRRSEISEKAYQESINAAHVAFPPEIAELIGVCKENMLSESESQDGITSILAAFANRTPNFMYSMDREQGTYRRGLVKSIEMGNNDEVEEAKTLAHTQIAQLLEDLIAALSLLVEKMGSKVGDAVEARNDGSASRADLVAAIETELGYLTTGPDMGQLGPILQALQEGGNLPGLLMDGTGFRNPNANEDDEDDEEDDQYVEGPKKRQGKSSKMDDDAIDNIMENEHLSTLQKEEALEQAQGDMERLDMQMQREKARKEDALAKEVKARANRDEEEDTSGILHVNEKELEELKKNFDNNRDQKVSAMERVEYAGDLSRDSPHDVRVATLAVNRYLASLRCLGVHSRLGFAELGANCKKKRAALAQKLMNEQLSERNDDHREGRYFNQTAGNVGIAPVRKDQRTGASIINYIEEHPLMHELYADEQKGIEDLNKKLDQDYVNLQMVEDGQREKWMSDPSHVHLDSELIRLRSECASEFSNYRKRNAKITDTAADAYALETEVRKNILQTKSGAGAGSDESNDDPENAFKPSAGLPQHLVDGLLDAMNKEAESRQQVLEQESAETGRIIAAEEFSLGYILNFADSWGPRVDNKAQQRSLFERAMSNVQIFSDVHNRLELEKLALKDHMEAVSQESSLYKRSADKKEVDMVLANMDDRAKENIAVLSRSLQDETQNALDNERKRQEESYVGYEVERSRLVGNDACNLLQSQIEVDGTKRDMALLIRAALENKKADLHSLLDQQAMSEDTQLLARRQIDNECLREELELRAAFAAIGGENIVSMRYSNEVTEGKFTPSVDWAQLEIKGFHNEEGGYLKEALVYDVSRRSLKKKFTCARAKELEQMRLMSLGRPAKDLDKVFGYLTNELMDQLQLLDTDYYDESKHLEEMNSDSMQKRQNIHDTFHDDVFMIHSDAEHNLEDTNNKFQEKIEDLNDSDSDNKEMVALNQSHAAGIAAVQLDEEERMFKAFKDYYNKAKTLERVEDDLRQLRAELQQQAEAAENIIETAKTAKYRDLIEAQIRAKAKKEALKNQYEQEVSGLDEAMRRKKEQQAQFLKDRLAKKRANRKGELKDQGLSDKEAEKVAAEELEQDTKKTNGELENLDKNLDSEIRAEKGKIAKEDEEKQKDYLDEHNRALKIAEDGLKVRKQREKEALEARLKAKRDKRLKELTDAGMSEAVAKKMVAKELGRKYEAEEQETIDNQLDQAAEQTEHDLDDLGAEMESSLDSVLEANISDVNNDSTLTKEQKQSKIAKLKDDYDMDLALLKASQEKARKVLSDGMENTREHDRKRMLERLNKKRAARTTELQQVGGLSEEVAKAQANDEIAEEMQIEQESIDKQLESAKEMLDTVISDDYSDKLKRLKNLHEDRLKGLQGSLEAKHKNEKDSLADRLARRKKVRKHMLEAKGVEGQDIDDILDKEFGLLEDQQLSDKALMNKLQKDANSAEQSKTEALKTLKKEADEQTAADADKLDNEVLGLMDNLTQLGRESSENQREINRLKLDNLREASKGDDRTADELNNLRQDHEKAVLALQDDFALKKKEEESLLAKRLAAKKKKKAAALRAQSDSKNKVDQNASAEEKENAIKNMTEEIEGALNSSLEEGKAEIQSDSSLSKEQKLAMVAKLEEDFQAELQRVKEQEEKAKAILENGLENTKENDKKHLLDRLKKKKANAGKAVHDLVQEENISETEANARVQADMERYQRDEEQKLKENYSVADELITSTTAAALSQEEQDRIIAESAAREKDSAISALEMRLKMSEEKALHDTAEQNAKLEMEVIEREKAAAAAQAALAAAAEQDAHSKLDTLRNEQEAEYKTLQAQMNDERKSNDDKLKQRLKDKRAKKLADLTAKHASDEEKQAEEDKLAEDERQARLQEEEEQRKKDDAALADLERSQAKAAQEAKRILAKAEMEAAAAKSKDDALASAKELQERSENEINQKEVARVKAMAMEMAEKADEEKSRNEKSKKLKLGDRLKAKREKKAKDLADQEAKKLSDLAAQQFKDSEAKEALRKSKMIWTEHLEKAMSQAKEVGLSGSEFEDYCLNETLGKNLVGPQHMSQCVERICSDRHTSETSALIETNFNERMQALKEATTAVLNEKNEKRVSILAALTKEGASEEIIEQEVEKLDQDYQQKQLQAEKNATAVLEQSSMKFQMELRQKQLEDISKIIMLHSDADTMAALQQNTGKSKLEELAEYRARLESERKERENSMAKQREEEEANHRKEMEEHMAEMREKLLLEQKNAEDEYKRQKQEIAADIEKKRQEMETELQKQKDAMKNTVDDAQDEIHRKEQDRIRKEFEKEAEKAMNAANKDRASKADKLKTRLANKRKKKAGSTKNAAPTGEPPSALKDAAEQVTTENEENADNKDGESSESPKKKTSWADLKKKKAESSQSSSKAASIMPDPQLTNALTMLTQKLSIIEEKLNNIDNDIVRTPRAPAPKIQASENSGIPPYNAFTAVDEPAVGQSTQLMSDADLHIQQRARLEFANRVAYLLKMPTRKEGETKGLSIRGAISLSPASTSGNAFANSYHYDPATETLAIHVDRLKSSGDLGLIVVHALSHVKVDPRDLSNDAEPAFLQEFYSNFKVLSSDLYKYSSSAVAGSIADTMAFPAMGDTTGAGFTSSVEDLNSTSNNKSNPNAMKKMSSRLMALTGSIKEDTIVDAAAEKQAQAPTSSREAYYSQHSLAERMRAYASASKDSAIPLSYLDRYEENGSPTKPSKENE